MGLLSSLCDKEEHFIPWFSVPNEDFDDDKIPSLEGALDVTSRLLKFDDDFVKSVPKERLPGTGICYNQKKTKTEQ